MPQRINEIRYLREKAAQFRDLAARYDTALSEQLLGIAAEFERRADELEQRH